MLVRSVVVQEFEVMGPRASIISVVLVLDVALFVTEALVAVVGVATFPDKEPIALSKSVYIRTIHPNELTHQDCHFDFRLVK